MDDLDTNDSDSDADSQVGAMELCNLLDEQRPFQAAQQQTLLFVDDAYQDDRLTESVEIESCLRQQYKQFREGKPANPSLRERERYSKWLDDNYYAVTRDFFIEKSYSTGEYQHRFESTGLLPLLTPATTGDIELRQVAIRLCAETREVHVPMFDIKLRKRWSQICR